MENRVQSKASIPGTPGTKWTEHRGKLGELSEPEKHWNNPVLHLQVKPLWGNMVMIFRCVKATAKRTDWSGLKLLQKRIRLDIRKSLLSGGQLMDLIPWRGWKEVSENMVATSLPRRDQASLGKPSEQKTDELTFQGLFSLSVHHDFFNAAFKKTFEFLQKQNTNMSVSFEGCFFFSLSTALQLKMTASEVKNKSPKPPSPHQPREKIQSRRIAFGESVEAFSKIEEKQ